VEKAKVIKFADFTERGKSIISVLSDIELMKDDIEEIVVMVKKKSGMTLLYSPIKDPVWWSGILNWLNSYFSTWVDEDMWLVD
jgi:hypothetical protein